MERVAVQPEPGPKPAGPYSSGIKAGGFLFVAGQTSRDGNGNIVGKGDLAAQTRQAWDNVKAVVEAAGGTMDDVVSATKYVLDIDAYLKGPSRQVGQAYFSKPPPADTLVQVSRLASPDLLIEIQAIAYIAR